MFDPAAEGIGAIKGGCTRCLELQAIFESHNRTLKLMQGFAPVPAKSSKPKNPVPDEQQDLFPSLP
jgi:hypothetical protein